MRASHSITAVLSVLMILFASVSLFGGKLVPNPLYTPDRTGVLSTYSTAGGIEADSITFELCRRLLDGHLLVSEDEIKSAMRLLIERERWIIEGAAGVAVAALLKEAHRYRGQQVVAVLCGRNIAAEKLRELW